MERIKDVLSSTLSAGTVTNEQGEKTQEMKKMEEETVSRAPSMSGDVSGGLVEHSFASQHGLGSMSGEHAGSDIPHGPIGMQNTSSSGMNKNEDFK
ncbi:hypothetical protein FDP41_013706 [Naegleria fowleri]|uniref:Uncharacterized protein n=1 Tax=Naegleria fowleri TaxID=5763 RepID=A0A6A5C123_NAEFO|nr:uncharacterized protein FDP41_013706 [Naegleria fowleri]KAF0980492.1 hypothetical protein FDP41_013706 [Naegleria fowleri]CAG4710890.1 unnamed protein product [Naegleria fowleri]